VPSILKLAGLLVAAALGAFLLRETYVVASRPRPPEPPAVEHIRAAADYLPDGLLLRDSDLVWKRVPRADVPAGAIVQGQPGADDLKGDLLRHAVTAGTPIGRADVISPDAPDFLAAALKPGMRAISVAIDDVSGNAGLIQPGDYVDLLLTQQIDTRTAGGASAVAPDRAVEAETIANRLRVLAVGSAFQRAKGDAAQNSSGSRARTVTFEVTPRTTQVIAVASHLGSLSLALRSFATRDRRPPDARESVEALSPPVWAGDVSRALHAAPSPVRAASARAAAATVPAPVIVYRGSKVGDSAGALPGTTGTPGLPPLPPDHAAGTPIPPASTLPGA
jgi:pilus assembly protein CpaB